MCVGGGLLRVCACDGCRGKAVVESGCCALETAACHAREEQGEDPTVRTSRGSGLVWSPSEVKSSQMFPLFLLM